MKTKYDWSGVDPEVKWIATDESGLSWQFTREPHIIGFEWVGGIYASHTTEFEGNWQDSLEERPNEFN